MHARHKQTEDLRGMGLSRAILPSKQALSKAMYTLYPKIQEKHDIINGTNTRYSMAAHITHNHVQLIYRVLFRSQ